VLRIGDDFG